MLNFLEAKHAKDIALAGVIPRESFAKNSLAELFHVGVLGPIVNGRHKRIIRSGMSGKRALRQKKLLEVEEVTESQTAEKAGLSMAHPSMKLISVNCRGLGQQSVARSLGKNCENNRPSGDSSNGNKLNFSSIAHVMKNIGFTYFISIPSLVDVEVWSFVGIQSFDFLFFHNLRIIFIWRFIWVGMILFFFILFFMGTFMPLQLFADVGIIFQS